MYPTTNVNWVGQAADTQDRANGLSILLGLLSAASLIFNRVIGTGYVCLALEGDTLTAVLYTSVFAAPSIILNSSGSVGMTFVMWILGALASAAGTAVYVEFGTVRHTTSYWHSFSDCTDIGSSSEWWGKDLHGVCLSTPCILDHLHLRSVWHVHRECAFHAVLCTPL